MPTESDFSQWLQEELDKRGWRQAELVRKSGLSSGYISQILNREKLPKAGACRSIAKAFNMKDVDVLARAGLIDPIPPTDTPNIRKMIEKFSRLSDEDQIYMLRVISGLEKEEQERSQSNNHLLRPAKP